MSRSTKPSGSGKASPGGRQSAHKRRKSGAKKKETIADVFAPLITWRRRVSLPFTKRIDALAAHERQRFAAAMLLAIIVNGGVLVALSIFGEVRIWVPNRPSTTISLVFADLTIEPDVPELIRPETIKDPEPEPEIIEEPELEEEPAPDPKPEEAEPEPEPIIDLTPEPVDAPLSEEQDAAQDALENGEGAQDDAEALSAGAEGEDPADAGLEQETLENDALNETGEEAAGEEDAADITAQEDTDLVEEADANEGADEGAQEADLEENGGEAGLEIAEQEGLDEGEMALGDETPGFENQGDETQGDALPELPFDDDFFDKAPTRRFVKPRFALPLPGVSLPETALPEGEAAALPGRSGVVAIVCPEEFSDEEKQKECAGRPEIRSGWRPGASGEDFTQAARLLQADRARGGNGAGGGVRGAPAGGLPTERVFGPDVARRIEEQERRRLAQEARQETGGETRSLPDEADALGDALARPDLSGGDAVPAWARRDNAPLTEREIEELEKALDEAARNQGAE